MLTEIPMWLQVRDFASIALWQRQMAAAHLDDMSRSSNLLLSLENGWL